MMIDDVHDDLLTNEELNDLIVYAFRYCLGRRTYAVHDINKIIRKYITLLNTSTLILIQKEINQAIKDNNVGMDFDKKEWQDTYILISNSLNL